MASNHTRRTSSSSASSANHASPEASRTLSRRAFAAAGGVALGTVAAGGAVRQAHASFLDNIVNALTGGEGDAAETAGATSQSAAPASSSASAGSATGTATTRPMLIKGLAETGEVQQASVVDTPWAADLSNVVNASYTYLKDSQRDTLSQLGFFQSLGNGGYEFFETYERNRYNLYPSFVTVDSMVHTYHLYFVYVLRNAERYLLSTQLADLSRRMLAASCRQAEALAGTEWESAAQLVAGFFAVGTSLLDAGAAELAQVPSAVQGYVDAELALIYAAGGIQHSPLFEESGLAPSDGSSMGEDYSQYAPRGYYEGDAALEPYFRAMMWYGRRNFTQTNETLDRCALLMTLALAGPDEASGAGATGLGYWEGIYQATSFFAGASDDNGYYEYLPLVEQAYGAVPATAGLPGDDAAWQAFHRLTAEAPAPRINSVPMYDAGEGADHVSANQGFRFMGQRFSIDASIFQRLIYSEVGERSDGSRRMLPDVLDVAAAFGSENAYAILEEQGDTSYPNYPENMAELRQTVAGATEDQWRASLASQWLDMLRPLLEEKGAGWPAAMQGDAWARKNLQTFAGSYTELKHDTVLYAKQVMAEGGGGPLEERDDRGYVEPEPEVFGRLAALVQATVDGLSGFGMLGAADVENLGILQQLATQLQTIANKELRNELPTDEEFDLIRSFGVQLEHFWKAVHAGDAEATYFATSEFPAALVVDIATDPNGTVLEIGTGTASTLYVIVPVDGVLRIASGPVFSFYQFEQPIDQRLTDSAWRQMLGIQRGEDGRYQDYAVTQANIANVVPWVSGFTKNSWDE